ncbi:MAG: molybdate ABC transporter permease subunit [Thermomicrobiales bacterium]|nr:molybdate ABC transporter permease subunit [Thermomicrobiales bacterium]MCO5223139.1 ABC transporter permease [Thermomicrobiales bacterium]
MFLALPLLGLLWRTIERFDGVTHATSTTLRQALRLSFTTTLISLAIVLLLATPLAFLLGRHDFRGKRLVETIVDLPMVLPPAVAGLALLMAFGRRGLVGEYLNEQFGIAIGFTTTAVVMAQVFVSAPFYIRSAQAGFARYDRGVEEAAADLGASPLRVLKDVTFPIARPALGAGAVLAWARALGEFGATIMFAGSIAGRTETMPLAVYGRYEAGDLDTALLLSVILVGCATLVLLSVRLTGGRSSS